ncbi:MAG: hypothetical protein IKN54_07405 [Lachnospiraceae bacterium]|nr:hypothetical protein [Lachnospiraceae bacterium]
MINYCEKIKKHWVTVWLVTAILVFSYVVQAEYSDARNRVKRVAANVTSEGQLFSSNYLMPGSIELKRIQTTAEDGYCVVPVNIYNYNISNPTKAYQSDLAYTLTLQLVDSTNTPIAHDNPDVAVVEVSTDGVNYNTLSWNSTKNSYYQQYSRVFNTVENGNYISDKHVIYIRYPSSVLANDPGIYVEAIAVPTDAKTFSSISAILGVQAQGTTFVRGWGGDFYDDKNYRDYDAFNYVITGNGTATITLEWCSDYLELNEVNISEYSQDIDLANSNLVGSTKTIGTVTGTWKKLVINADDARVDGQNVRIGRNRYGLQFYMTGNPTVDYGYDLGTVGFWSTVEKYVNLVTE